MADRGTQSQSDYVIKEAIITNSNLTDDIIIGDNIAQLVLYEDIRRPYLTGELVIKDDVRMFDTVQFNGTEILNLTLQQPQTSGKEVTKEFVIQKVIDTQKLNDQSEILAFKLIQRQAFNNSLIKFSKAYTDTPENIIKKILFDQLGLDISIPDILPAQQVMRVTIPYLTPFAACEWIRDRMSTPSGFPYALYQSLNDNVICLKSYEEMLTEPAWNADPYRFSQAYSQSAAFLTAEQQAFIIQTWSQPNADDMMKFISTGSIATDVSVFDVTSGKKEFFHLDMNAIVQTLREKNIIDANQVSDFRMQYDFKEKALGDNSAFKVDRVIMNNTYGDDVNNYYQETTADKFRLDMMNLVIRAMLEKSPVNIDVQGGLFLSGQNATIGKNINVVYMNNNPEIVGSKNNPDDAVLKDYKRSGKYMISAARHSFQDTRHTASLGLSKIANEDFVKVYT